MSLILRPALAADPPRLLEIWREAELEAHPFFSAEERTEREKFLRAVYLPQAETWAAESHRLPSWPPALSRRGKPRRDHRKVLYE